MRRHITKSAYRVSAVISFSKSNGLAPYSSNCPPSVRNSIQFTAVFRFADFLTHSSSATTARSFVLSRLRTVDAGHATGRRAYRTANKRVQPTCEDARG